MAERPIFTYQTRLDLDAAQAAALDAYAALYAKAERSLFAVMQSDVSLNDLKREFLQKYGITARQFNAVRTGLEGKIDSIKARRPELIAQLQGRIKKAQKVVAVLSLRSTQGAKLHQKKRRLHILQTKLDAIQADHKEGRVGLCFGSKKLFNAQFDLQANGYADHAAWKADWMDARCDQFFVLGSQDETAGNQSCQAQRKPDGSLTLHLRLPNACETDHGKSLLVPGVKFTYGHDKILAALATSQRVASTTKAGKPIVKRIGSALSYRFVRDVKGWRVFVSCEAQPIEQSTNTKLGAIGVDINADHLAVSETDRFGNLVLSLRIDLHTYGKTTDQAKALIGDAAVRIADLAKAKGKPIVIEKLDFSKKKAELEATNKPLARMLSSLACNKVFASIKAAAFRGGVEVLKVNPAYTSVIGAVNHAQKNGISVHMGAALAIARRALGLSEKPPKRGSIVPTRNGGHVAFCVPARNRTKHVWSHWVKIRTGLKVALVAHGRSGVPKAMPAPLSPEMRTLGAIRPFTAKSRDANRQQHCLAGVTTSFSASVEDSAGSRFE
jgi:IS605 OrfB family transposase